mgnify:CR=1 FL=1
MVGAIALSCASTVSMAAVVCNNTGPMHISAAEEMTVADIARVIWESCGEDPEQFELEHLPTFEVDVVRRWPDVSKARELLGWEAQTDLRDGIARTVAWLREREG